MPVPYTSSDVGQIVSGVCPSGPCLTYAALQNRLNCRETPYFCSAGDFGISFPSVFLLSRAYEQGTVPGATSVTEIDGFVYNFVLVPGTGVDTWIEAPPIQPYYSPPALRVVFNPMTSTTFTPQGEGLSSCGVSGENTDGTHWCMSFGIFNNSQMVWPAVKSALQASGGISPTSVPVTVNNVPGNGVSTIYGAFSFTADLYNQFCTASVQMYDGCGNSVPGGVVQFPLYPILALSNSKVDAAYGEFTCASTKFSRIITTLVISGGYPPPGTLKSLVTATDVLSGTPLLVTGDAYCACPITTSFDSSSCNYTFSTGSNFIFSVQRQSTARNVQVSITPVWIPLPGSSYSGGVAYPVFQATLFIPAA